MIAHMSCLALPQNLEWLGWLYECFRLNIQQAIGCENRWQSGPQAIQPSLAKRRVQHDQIEGVLGHALECLLGVARMKDRKSDVSGKRVVGQGEISGGRN